ncbi:MAG: MlaD family protein [Solirubrobacteraceae bacterium]
MRRRRRHYRHVRFGRVAILVQALGAIAFLGYLLSHEALQLPLLSHNYTVRAAFLDAGGLNGSYHSPVLVAGVPEGRVQAVTYQHGLAVATLELPDSVKRLVHSDATVNIVPRSGLEDQMVDITPGSAGAPPLAAGTMIAPRRTGSTVGFDRLIDVLDADTRAQVGILLSQLDIGLHGRSVPLRDALQQLGPLVDGTTTVTAALAERRVLLSELVASLDRMVTTLGQHGSDLAGAVDAGQRTLAVTAARSAQLSGIMRALPGTLGQLTGAMSAVRTLAGPLDPALAGLMPFARALPGALISLQRFDPAGVRLLSVLRGLERTGTGPALDLRRTLTALGPSAQRLVPSVADLHPILQDINVHKQGIGQLGDNFSGVFSTNDLNGPILRGLGFFETFNPADMGFPGATGPRLATAQAESIAALTRVCLHVNPVACLIRYLVPGLTGAVVPLSQAARIVGGGG